MNESTVNLQTVIYFEQIDRELLSLSPSRGIKFASKGVFVKLFSALMIALFLSVGHAEEKLKWNFKDEDLTKIIEIYSKASGQKFIVDSAARGKASLFNQEPVTLEEAFNQLSAALAVNNLAIVKKGDYMIVKNARSAEKDSIEVGSERPSLKPERMYTWIYTVKNRPADAIKSQFQNLTGPNGDLQIDIETNQIIVTDFVSNINRVADILQEVDKKADPSVAHYIEASKEQYQKNKEMRLKAMNAEKTETK